MSDGITKSDRILHTPGTFAKNHLLYVQEVGILQSLVPHVCKRENVDSYLIFEVLEGRGTIKFKNEKFELHKGECVWIDCNYAFEHVSSKDEPWELVWVHFNGKCATEFYDVFCEKNEIPVFIPSASGVVQSIIRQILGAVKENISELEIHSMLTQLIVVCTKTVDQKGRVQDIREYINANYKENRLIELLVERFGMSVNQLEDVFGKNYGIGLYDYILNRRFNVAKELLRFTIRPINEVVEASGIEDEELFYQLFRENEGMNPEEYRKNWAQWIKD